MKDAYATDSHHLTYTFLFERLGECALWLLLKVSVKFREECGYYANTKYKNQPFVSSSDSKAMQMINVKISRQLTTHWKE